MNKSSGVKWAVLMACGFVLVVFGCVIVFISAVFLPAIGALSGLFIPLGMLAGVGIMGSGIIVTMHAESFL
jgi:hypothetical protein